ncbi:MAG: NYN domain-containing protein [Akkermansiaceae bacterium]
MEQVLIVDGHSAIFAWQDLRDLHQENPRRARLELVSMLTQYHDVTGCYVVVVFDGKGVKTDREGGKNGDILVMYSRSGETADTVIERIVARKSSDMRITVASNDRAELETVSAFGGDCIGLKTLREMLDRADEDHRRTWDY